VIAWQPSARKGAKTVENFAARGTGAAQQNGAAQIVCATQ
jgi:hypothetical protein